MIAMQCKQGPTPPFGINQASARRPFIHAARPRPRSGVRRVHTKAAVNLSSLQQLLFVNPQTAYAAAGIRTASDF